MAGVLTPLPYQLTGAEWLKGHTAGILGDDPGLGKTMQTILAIKAMSPWDMDSILIVCPAHLKLVWAREWKMWMGKDAGKYPAPVIMSYNVAWKKDSPALARLWTVAIFDEAHFLKNRTAKRTKKLLGQQFFSSPEVPGGPRRAGWKGGVRASWTWFLTGTPITVGPKDFFNLLNRCAPFKFPNRFAFEQMYCDGHYGDFGWVADGASMITDLRRQIEGVGILLRRMKAEVLTQLPPKRRQVIEIPKDSLPLDPEDKAAIRTSQVLFERILADVGITEEQMDTDAGMYERVMERLRFKFSDAIDDPKREHGAETAHDLRQLLAPIKVKAFAAWAKVELGENRSQKAVVWAHYHTTVDALCVELEALGISHVRFTGREGTAARDAAVQQFQTGTVQVMVASSAGYTGLTLTAADRAVFIEPSTVPTENTQAEDRIHRIGQKNSVLIQYLVVQGSYDVKMMHMMISRMSVFSELMDGKSLTQKVSL